MKETFPKLCGSIAGDASELGVKMHNAGYEAKNLDYTYIAMGSEDIEETLKTVKNMNFRGLGVSMPFKESIIEHLDEIGEDVETIGACNTVVFENGKTIGHNTDWRGAIRALKETGSLDEVERAEIIGAGGVARAIAYGLKQEDIKVSVSARSDSQREELVEDLNLENQTNLDGQGKFGAELVVNATPVAEQPNSPVELGKHSEGEWLLDVVFGQPETDIIEAADERDWKATKGWRMLLHQGLEQFELYTGEDGPEEAMGNVLENTLGS
ncbi:MAG: shikimate dehydrogenase [Candidatus Nanohalobium sp.]